MYGLELGRIVWYVQGRGHVVAASRLQLVMSLSYCNCSYVLLHLISCFMYFVYDSYKNNNNNNRSPNEEPLVIAGADI